MTELEAMSQLTESQRVMFISEMGKVRKDRSTALLLTLFLGGVGGHHFYMGRVALGVFYLLFCWSFIPLIIAFFELFTIMGQVDTHNEKEAEKLFQKVKAIR